jgi:hypothetical protein
LEPLRGAVSALPFGTVLQALRDVAGVIAEVLGRLTAIIGTVQAAIETAAGTAVAGLTALENALDTFKGQLDQVFAQATGIIAAIDLEAKLGLVQGKIDAFADVIAKADMSPYFGTARDAIDSTAGVIERVPFDLLPDEMEQDVVDAVRPIKTVDAEAVRQEILALLQIEEDGGFGLRDELEAGLASIQAQVDGLIAAVRDDLDPGAHAGALDAALADAKAAIETVAPAIDLAPLREALDAAKQAVADLDPAAALAPVTAAFDDLLAGIDALSPDRIVGPIDDRIDAARAEFLRLTRLQDLRDRLDGFAEEAKNLRRLVDVESLPGEIETGLAAWRRQLKLDPRLQALDGIFATVVGFLDDSPERVQPRAFRAIADWFSEGGAAAALAGRTDTIRDATGQVREAVAAADPVALAEHLAGQIDGLRVAIAVHPAGPERTRLEAGLTITGDLAELRGLRQAHAGYLAQLDASIGTLNDLGTGAFSELDVVTVRIKAAFAGFEPLANVVREVRDGLGLGGLEGGLTGLFDHVFEILPPDRMVRIAMPLYRALERHYDALIDAVINPFRATLDGLIAAIEAIDLSPLRDDLNAIHGTVRDEIAAFAPAALLAEPLSAFAEARTALQGFDPLAAITALLDELRERALRLVGKLEFQVLFSGAIELHGKIVRQLEALQVQRLLAPLFDQLDAIAAQVAQGLGDTAEAFQRLQDALPDQVGSTSVSAGASVSVG